LIICHILFKFIQPQSPTNLGNSSIPTSVIPLNSGNILVEVSGSFTKPFIEKLRSSDLPQLFHGSHLGTLARKENAMILSMNGR